MTGYFVVEAAILAPTASMLITVAIRSANERRLARRALRLADRRIAILNPRKARAMERALVAFLGTAAGASLAGDRQVAERLDLFLALRGERASRPIGPRHRKADDLARTALSSQPVRVLARQYETA